MSRLREKYEKEVTPAMMKEFVYSSIMAVPRIKKVTLNMGLGEAIYNIKAAPENLRLSLDKNRLLQKLKSP